MAVMLSRVWRHSPQHAGFSLLPAQLEQLELLPSFSQSQV